MKPLTHGALGQIFLVHGFLAHWGIINTEADARIRYAKAIHALTPCPPNPNLSLSSLSQSLFGRTDLVRPGLFPLKRWICTANPACQPQKSQSNRVRQIWKTGTRNTEPRTTPTSATPEPFSVSPTHQTLCPKPQTRKQRTPSPKFFTPNPNPLIF